MSNRSGARRDDAVRELAETGRPRRAIVNYFDPRYLNVAFFLAFRTMKQESLTMYLGVVWWFLNPFFMMVVYYFLGTVIFKTRTSNYAAFLLVGLVTWRWAQSGVTACAGAIKSNIQLLRSTYMPKYVLILKEALVATQRFLFGFAVLLAFLYVSMDYSPNWAYIYLPVLFAFQFLLILAAGSFFAPLVPLVPDLQNVLNVVLSGAMFLSGVLWSRDHLPEQYHVYFDINPLAILIQEYRRILIDGQPPELGLLIWFAALALAVLAVSHLVLKRLDGILVRIVP